MPTFVQKTRNLPGSVARIQLLATLTRPNDTTAYAAGDVYGDVADARHHIVLVPPSPDYFASIIRIISEDSVAPGGTSSPGLQMFCFNAQPATILGDNAVFDPSLADMNNKLILTTAPGGFAGAFGGTTLVPVLNANASMSWGASPRRQSVSGNTNPFLDNEGLEGNITTMPLDFWAYFVTAAAFNPDANHVTRVYGQISWQVRAGV